MPGKGRGLARIDGRTRRVGSGRKERGKLKTVEMSEAFAGYEPNAEAVEGNVFDAFAEDEDEGGPVGERRLRFHERREDDGKHGSSSAT